MIYTPFQKGIISGSVSCIVCSPFDVLRTRYQISGTSLPIIETYSTLFKKEGTTLIKTGIKSNIYCIPIWWGMYHHTNNFLKSKNVWIGWDAFIAGNISSLVTNPLFVLRTRMLSGLYGDRISTNIVNMIKTDGVKIFTKGYMSTVIHNGQLSVIMPLFDWGKDNFSNKESKFYTYQIMVISAIAKFIGGSIFYPTEVIRSRIRQSSKQMNFKEVIYCASFKPFSGYKVHTIRSIPATVSALTVYELLK
jgi:hypothetical protein